MEESTRSSYLSQDGDEVMMYKLITSSLFGGKLYLRIVLFLNFSRNGLKYWSIVYFSATKLQGYASGVARRNFSLLGHTPWSGALHILLPTPPLSPCKCPQHNI